MDAAEALDRHADELLAVPGVIGVSVGEREGEPCIRVMVREATPEVRSALPRTLEGYPVEIDETGEIVALDES